jgi:hypothetical protein
VCNDFNGITAYVYTYRVSQVSVLYSLHIITFLLFLFSTSSFRFRAIVLFHGHRHIYFDPIHSSIFIAIVLCTTIIIIDSLSTLNLHTAHFFIISIS